MSFRDMLTVISWRWIMMLSTHSVHLPLLPACLAVHSDSSPVFSPFPPPLHEAKVRETRRSEKDGLGMKHQGKKKNP